MSWYDDDPAEWTRLSKKLIHLVDIIITRLEESETPTTYITLSTKEGIMANYQLNANDSVVVTITDTDSVTGLPVSVDPGSVTAVLSSATDSVVSNTDGTYTIVSGTTLGTGNTLTVNATVGGVSSAPAVGTYDVVADVVSGNPTTLSVTFGTETAPAAVVAAASVIPTGMVAGQINPVTGLVNP